LLLAGQFAVIEQLPVPLVIVIVALLVPLPEHAPLAVIVALAPELVVELTPKLPPYTSLDGAPVNVTVGVARVAVVDWLAVAPA
jgi:hypothetical protein